MKKTVAAVFAAALTLALAVFAGAALAGDHGGGDAHGNSASAPGQVQQSSQSQQTQQPSQDHGSSKHQEQSQQVQSGGDNSQGVKPSSSTTSHKDTYAQAGSSQTKSYGNGKTAGQIAEQNGASPTTVLHGPGNSQPHKASLCPGGHERDVHALKGGSGSCAQPQEQKRAEQQHVQKQVEHVQQQQEQKPQSEVKAVSSEQKTHYGAHEKVYICHATGSATNPYVLIHVSKNALAAHTAHQDGRDIVLGDSADKGCPQPQQAQAPIEKSTSTCSGSMEQQKSFSEHEDEVVVKTDCNQAQVAGATQAACTQTVTVTVPGGVWHHTGSSTNPYVFIHPSGNSAHYSKHEDDVVVAPMTKTESVQVPCSQATQSTQAVQTVLTQCQQAQAAAVQAAKPEEQQPQAQSQATPQVSSQASSQASAQAPAQQTQQQPAQQSQPTSGVAGAQATLPAAKTAKAKPKTIAAAAKPATHGVLGAQATLKPHHGLLGTVASATLPFTGLPLWPVVLGAIALIMAGIAVRRTQRGTI